MKFDTRKLPVNEHQNPVSTSARPGENDLEPQELPAFIRFHIADTGHAIRTSVRQVITIGRHDPSQGIRPDVDLAPYRGYYFGVSRRHAIILRQKNSLFVRSLNTTNGTGLNGQSLMPGLEYPIRNGDDLIIGGLSLKVEMIPAQADV